MDVPSTPGGTHPVLAAAAQVAELLKGVRDVDPVFMSAEEKKAALVALPAVRDEVEALWLRLLAASSEVADETGARDVGAWLTGQARIDRPATAGALRLARALGRWPQVGAALGHGQVSVAQARVITGCLDALAEDDGVPAEVLAKAEAELIRLAAVHTPADLRRLGERIVALVAPGIGEEADRRALERAEARASAATRLTLRRRGDGSTDLHARLPDATAARLKTYLDAYTSPRTAPVGTPDSTGASEATGSDPATGARLPTERLAGEAFCALLEAIPATAMPLHGGSATTLVVTVDLETLRTGLGAAETGDGTAITASEARRLACTAGIIPAVLDGASQPLDLGRRRRLYTFTQRIALGLQHKTCRAAGCTVPATWCEAHHRNQPWSQGGRTDLAEGELLCCWHHHRAHDPNYHTVHHPDGTVTFHRRT